MPCCCSPNLPSNGTRGYAALDLDEVPIDFDWKAYLRWNPEAGARGAAMEEEAEADYQSSGGRGNGRVYKAIEMTIRYTACGSVMEQQYCHISALAVASLSNVTRVITPPVAVREVSGRSSDSERRPDTASKYKYVNSSEVWDVSALGASMQGVPASQVG